MTLLLISLAGGAGAAARFVADGVIARRLASSPFPPGIVIVNIVGSFILGLIVGLAASGAGLPTHTAAILGTGFCGGFTTFSTASLEAVHLWVNDGRRDAVAYVLVTLVGSLSAAAIGLSLV